MNQEKQDFFVVLDSSLNSFQAFLEVIVLKTTKMFNIAQKVSIKLFLSIDLIKNSEVLDRNGTV